MFPQFLIGAASSGSGKTTLTLGLLRALCRRGWDVAAFKCGPDYLDTRFHTLACGNESVNLDLFMGSESLLSAEYSAGASGKDCAIVEGVMGLFDGYERWHGSSGEIAERLRLPVILVVNAASTAYSVAATIAGFSNFREGVRIVGVVFNRVASESHYSFLAEACKDAGVESLGNIKRNENLTMPSRHLGLQIGDEAMMQQFIEAAADAVEQTVNIERLLELTMMPAPAPSRYDVDLSRLDGEVISVASDEAFSFIYSANLKSFERRGARLMFFSPLRDEKIPPLTTMLYLPGGYPELYAQQLAANIDMRRSVARFAADGGRIFAECGGMIYLTQDIDGAEMCRVLPTSCTMNNSRLTLGYRTIETPKGEFRGHEFHYSRLVDDSKIRNIALQRNARGNEVATKLFRQGNVVAGYTHFYWPETDIISLFE